MTLSTRIAPPADGAPAPARTGLAQGAVLLSYLAATATAWNGWRVGGLPIGDELLLLSFLLFALVALGRPWPELPAWAWIFGGAILVVTAAHQMWPTSPAYIDQRLVVDAAGNRIPEVYTNLGVGLKFLVPAIVMPFVFLSAAQTESRALRRLMTAFAIGSAISALLAFAQTVGGSNLCSQLTGVPLIDGRSPGLTVHPNLLATTCVISVPICLWLAVQGRAGARVVGAGLGVAQMLGIYSSGSRGGAAVVLLTIVFSVALIPAYRRALPTVAFLFVALAAVAFVAQPGLGESVLRTARLSGGGSSVTGSDLVRAEVGAQGMADFRHSPIDGIGMQVAAEAHDVYIQALASGGLILLTALLVVILGGLVRSARAFADHSIARPLFVAAVSAALLASLENSLTDRLAYVPVALCAALPARTTRADPDR